jgi:hypothetical protein
VRRLYLRDAVVDAPCVQRLPARVIDPDRQEVLETVPLRERHRLLERGARLLRVVPAMAAQQQLGAQMRIAVA